MHDAVVMQVSDRIDNGLNELGSIALPEVLLLADAIEQLAAETQISHEIHCENEFEQSARTV
jgi:hypothetical protein